MDMKHPIPGWLFEAHVLTRIHDALLKKGVETTAATAMVDGLLVYRRPPWVKDYTDNIPVLAQFLAIRDLEHSILAQG
jgi:hypothetical protein